MHAFQVPVGFVSDGVSYAYCIYDEREGMQVACDFALTVVVSSL